jgi:FMN phosphatase YigB (HAD superfamily)
MIKHVWFDLEETLTIYSPEFFKEHNNLLYQTYAKAVRKPITKELLDEFKKLYNELGSNSAVFRSLGHPSNYWQKTYQESIDVNPFVKAATNAKKTLLKLKKIVPISIFTNVTSKSLFSTLKLIDIDKEWFTHTINGDDIKERKPALDGFNLMIKKSNLLPKEILYVGDLINKDILPAKAVGMRTCLLWAKSDKADYSFEKFEEILNIFEQ